MIEKVYKSKCCNAEVRTDGIPDFLGSKDVCTVSFICCKCKKPCDTIRPKSQKKKVCVAEKSEMIELNVNDDIEIRLTKEGRKIYEEYRKKYGDDPLKKTEGGWTRVALWEFIHIFGLRMSMGAEAVIVGNTIRIPQPRYQTRAPV